MADSQPSAGRQRAGGASGKIRVHALAKELGLTSKEVIARLAELGVIARTASVGVDAAAADSLRAAVGGGETAVVEPVEETAMPELFSAIAAEAPVTPPPEPAPAGPLFLAPDPSAAMVVRRAAPAPAEADSESGDRSTDAGGSAAEDVGADEDAPVDAADDGVTADETDDAADGDARRGRGRRRRGRRGRGRVAQEESHDSADEVAATTDDADTTTTEDAPDSGPEDEETSGSTRRRRRRRRRGGSGAGPDDDPASKDGVTTVHHEREPRRRAETEVQGISGSTRLEARRQRRRDGRDASRRRPQVLSEAEFLARREAVDRRMVVRERRRQDHRGITTQVAVLEDDVLVEHFVTSDASASMVGNVYLGRVQNVLPSMEAAFIDIGRGRNGVLYAGEVNWDAAGLGGRARRIEQALSPGDQVLVQVSKDPVGHKGARLTTQVSLAGRFLVYVPEGGTAGISRKLPDTERRRLKAILKDILPPEAGVVIRTAAEGVSEEEITEDLRRLQRQWEKITASAADAKKAKGTAPTVLHEEPDMLVKVIRDLFNEDFRTLVIEGERAWDTVHRYVSDVAPLLLERVQRYEPTADLDVFKAHRIDEQLAKALDRKVWLPSGGTLIIERTEAMTVVDVNTGKFTGSGGNLEETVTRNNLEAAEEIVRQMRLRDIGGMIIVDFIDMVLESNRELVLRRLTEALGRDRTRHQVSEVTSLGLVQMTRKKLGAGLVEAFSTCCETCGGRGILLHADPVEAKTDGSNPASEGGGRRRRGRGGSGGGNGTQAEAGPDRTAHPVALAMAGKRGTGTDDLQALAEAAADSAAASEPAEFFTPAEEPAEDGDGGADTAGVTEDGAVAEDGAVTDKTAPRSRRRRRRSRRSGADCGAAGTEAEDAPAESAADPEERPEPETETRPEPLRRRVRRRAVRATSAPETAPESAAPVPAVVDLPRLPVPALPEPTAPEARGTRRPRRRATRPTTAAAD